MKKLRISVIIIMEMFFVSASFAQSNLSKYTFYKPVIIGPIPTSLLHSFYHISISNTNPLAKLTNFHYTAFFCKMELKALDRFGIWVKVHAGDYDGYTNGFVPR